MARVAVALRTTIVRSDPAKLAMSELGSDSDLPAIAANFRPLSAFRSAGSGGNAGQAGDYPAHERIDREKKRERDERPWQGMVPHERTLAEHA